MTTEPPETNRCAWITGAGSGIGRALAMRLAASGWTVGISARGEQSLHDAAAEAGPLPGRLVPLPLDVTDAEACGNTVRAFEAREGRIDLAVLNAGTHQPFGAQDFDIHAFRMLVDVNLMGTANSLAAVLPGMIERQGGRIALVASLAGYCGLPTAAAYGAGKAGVINMAEALRPELDRLGITLQLVNPGFVRTPLTDRNDFPMPFLMELEDAAQAFEKGLASDRFEIIFPRRFAWIMKLLRLLPYRVFFTITRRMLRR